MWKCSVGLPLQTVLQVSIRSLPFRQIWRFWHFIWNVRTGRQVQTGRQIQRQTDSEEVSNNRSQYNPNMKTRTPSVTLPQKTVWHSMLRDGGSITQGGEWGHVGWILILALTTAPSPPPCPSKWSGKRKGWTNSPKKGEITWLPLCQQMFPAASWLLQAASDKQSTCHH